MTHDRTRITALVDDELNPADRERMLAHVTSCADCRAVYLQERAAKRALAEQERQLATDPADTGPSLSLLNSLLSMADPGEPMMLGRLRDGGQLPSRPRTLPDQHARRMRRAAKGLGVSLVGVAALGVVAFALGGPDDAAKVQPPVARYVQEHARTAAKQPFGDVAADVLRTSTGVGP